MPRFMWYNPANPAQQYWTIVPSDPNIPSGYVFSQGTDGAQPEAFKHYFAGINNQGAGWSGTPSNADPTQEAAQPDWPNGILGGFSGGGVTTPKNWPNG